MILYAGGFFGFGGFFKYFGTWGLSKEEKLTISSLP